MPKITHHGVTNRLDPDPLTDDSSTDDLGSNPPEQEDQSSLGKSFEASPTPPDSTHKRTKSDAATRSNVPSTAGPSTTGRTDRSTASSAGTSSRRNSKDKQ